MDQRRKRAGMQWSLTLVGVVVLALLAATCSAGKSATNGTGTGGSSVGASGPGTTGSFANSTGSFSTSASATTGSGAVMCDPTSCTAAGGMCTNNVCIINENTGNVDATTKGLLDTGGSADPTFAWLYPYDATVFPRGLQSPALQFGGSSSPSAIKIHITAKSLDYTGYFMTGSPTRVALGAAEWKAVTLAAGPNDDVKIDATEAGGGQASGPITEHWSVAQGSLRGTIYYETYGSPLAGGLGSVGIMKIAPGAAQPVVIKTGCGNVCHTASADGSTLVASTAFPSGSASYDLATGAALIKAQPDNSFTYGGIYPDGSITVSATNYRTWVPGFGGGPSRVYDTHTGAQIPTPSWDSIITNAAMPAFSPDGKNIVFNREDLGQGRMLSTMAYDPGTKAFSGLTNIANDPSLYLGWPAFTPDSKWVVFHAGSNQVFETDSGATGDLKIVDAATHTVTRLDALDGYKAGSTYLPAMDPNLNFAPTILPEAVGGYFWVVFTSHRSYGNTLPTQDNMDQNGKLWVAALDLNPVAGKDASHPAFYLDGQEQAADNLRGFWVLDPCAHDGNTCSTGDQCCGGYCDGGMCRSSHMGCAQDFDKCSVASDCCNMADLCINGHCATPPPM